MTVTHGCTAIYPLKGASVVASPHFIMLSCKCPVYAFVVFRNDSCTKYCTCNGTIENPSLSGTRAHFEMFHANCIEVRYTLAQPLHAIESCLTENPKERRLSVHMRRNKPCPSCDEYLRKPDPLARQIWKGDACDCFLSLCQGCSEEEREEIMQILRKSLAC